MKRIIVVGCPGSGKSTFSRELHRVTGLPLYHLDMMYWNADKTTVEKEVFRKRLVETVARDEWIIDGNYGSTMEMRIAACDTVIFLDYPTELCLTGLYERQGKARADMPWVEEGVDEKFIAFVKSYNAESRPAVLKLLEVYADKTIYVFHNRSEADAFLQQWK